MASWIQIRALEEVSSKGLDHYIAWVLTKSDFLYFLDSPIHFWARINQRATPKPLSMFEQHLFEQGMQAEQLAKKFVEDVVLGRYEDAEILWQPSFTTDQLESRADAIIFDRTHNVYDVYEIKSSTSVKKEHKFDLGFQAIVYEENIEVRDYFLIHLNKEFVRKGEINIEALFLTSHMNTPVREGKRDVKNLIEQALLLADLRDPKDLETCLKPSDCVCEDICHPDLQAGSIFEINGLRKNKKLELIDMGVATIIEVPEDFALPAGQSKQVRAAKEGQPIIEAGEIQEELASLEYPLFFLDYEAFNPAIPYFDGYRPYQYIPFQYSLHIIEANGSKTEQIEYLDLDQGDPGERLAQHLLEHMQDSGSIIVWNKSFEMGRHKEMAALYANYREKLLGLNERIYDLMNIFRKGLYAHPEFKGKYSIKKILPVLVPDLSYESLNIPSGDETMMIWNDIHLGKLAKEKIEGTRIDMLEYCKLDTLAMLRIWEHLRTLAQ